MNEIRAGTVSHVYTRIRVVVIELEADLAVGDRVRFERHGTPLFEQEITSMHIEHRSIQSARRGQEIALRVEQEVRKGTEIYKLP